MTHLHPNLSFLKKISLYLCFLLIAIACNNESGTKGGSSEDNKTPTTDNPTDEVKEPQVKTILFFGNSLTAGYELEDPMAQSFTGVIQRKIDSLGLKYKVVNAGLSGETTAGGNERIEWVLQQHVDIFVLELGGNDGLRGIDPSSSYKNLEAIIRKVKIKYPDVKIILAGMEAPPNMGEDFTKQFRENYPKLAEANDAALIPFLLDGVGGIKELNLPDGIHPTVEGHQIVAENVWAVLKDLL